MFGIAIKITVIFCIGMVQAATNGRPPKAAAPAPAVPIAPAQATYFALNQIGKQLIPEEIDMRRIFDGLLDALRLYHDQHRGERLYGDVDADLIEMNRDYKFQILGRKGMATRNSESIDLIELPLLVQRIADEHEKQLNQPKMAEFVQAVINKRLRPFTDDDYNSFKKIIA